jgi:hypothetical protein
LGVGSAVFAEDDDFWWHVNLPCYLSNNTPGCRGSPRSSG